MHPPLSLSCLFTAHSRTTYSLPSQSLPVVFLFTSISGVFPPNKFPPFIFFHFSLFSVFRFVLSHRDTLVQRVFPHFHRKPQLLPIPSHQGQVAPSPHERGRTRPFLVYILLSSPADASNTLLNSNLTVDENSSSTSWTAMNQRKPVETTPTPTYCGATVELLNNPVSSCLDSDEH
jgi:hypothetical protein